MNKAKLERVWDDITTSFHDYRDARRTILGMYYNGNSDIYYFIIRDVMGVIGFGGGPLGLYIDSFIKDDDYVFGFRYIGPEDYNLKTEMIV